MSLQDLPDIFPPLPAPKCVVLYGDGFSSTLSTSHHHPNLDKLTNDGCVGALMLRNGDTPGRALKEFSQFLSMYDLMYDSEGKPKFELSETGKITSSSILSFPKQNFNLQSHLITSSPSTHNFCENLEFSGLSLISSNFAELKSDTVFKQISDILYSPQNSQTKVENVLVHLQAPQNDQPQLIDNGIKLLDELVAHLRTSYEDLFIIVVIGYGEHTQVQVPFVTLQERAGASYSAIAHIIPTQSYTQWQGKTLSIRETSPLFAVYYHRHFTRKDTTTIFNPEEFAKKNGNGKMPIDAFFPEVAFKQGKMPKYGA